MDTIYIADDSPTDRMLLAAVLTRLGFSVTPFESGESVYAALCESAEPVVAVLDWQMPDVSGIAICKRLMDDPPLVPVYAIVVTARSESDDIAWALDHGADDFIAKPFEPVELRARIQVGQRLLLFRSQLIESNQRLLDHTRQVEQLAQERARQLVRADRLSTLGVLSAGMAHEINNPASFIAVNLQLLEENIPLLNDLTVATPDAGRRDAARRFLELMPQTLAEMRSGVTRIRTIVDGLKTYARAESTRNEPFAIADCIQSALKLCTNRLKYHVSVTTVLEPVPRVFGDRYQMEQVFINLFTNAADAIEESGSSGTLTVATSCNRERVMVTVRNSGPQLTRDALDKLFLPFYTTKETGKGTGLGLSVSRSIVADHLGDMSARNSETGGVEFIIQLPVPQEDTQ